MKRLFVPILIALSACNSSPQKVEQPAQSNTESRKEEWWRPYGIDKSVPFDSTYTFVYQKDGKSKLIPSISGEVVEAEEGLAQRILMVKADEFQQKGQTLLCIERNFGLNNAKDKLALLNSTDQFQILSMMGTNGLNQGVTPEKLIKKIDRWNQMYQLQLTGAAYDWCEFKIVGKVEDWHQLAKEIYEFCPDVVDQGTGSVGELEQELKLQNKIFLWWD